MAKFHIKENGEPAVCRAEQGKCPFGPQSPHFSSKKEARKHYEESFGKNGLVATAVKTDSIDDLKKLQKFALDIGDVSHANQIQAYINERHNLVHRNIVGNRTQKINLASIRQDIFIDLDETVGSFEDDMRHALCKRDGISYEEALVKYPPNKPRGIINWWPADDPDSYSYKQFLDLEKRGLLYHDQPVRKGAGEVVNWLNKASDGKVKFLTARPAELNDVSAWWLKNRVGIDFDVVIGNSKKKEDIEGYDVLIDDNVSHVNAVSSEDAPLGARRTVFMAKPTSAQEVDDNEKISHAWTWDEVRNIFS